MDPVANIRYAARGDGLGIFALIKELAVFEKLESQVTGSPEALEAHLFCERPACEVFVALHGSEIVAYALFFGTYSTFRTQVGIYLEDLYVTPKWRNRGVGKALLSRLAALAVHRKCGRLEWSVLDWNQAAIDFYVALGAQPQEEWTMYRLTDESLSKLAHMDA